MEIRKLKASDAPAVARVHHQTFIDTYQGKMPDSRIEQLGRPESVEFWNKQLHQQRARSILLGAFADGELIGFAGAGEPRESWGYDAEIYAINIPARFQKQGAGRALVKASVEFCIGLAAQNLYLYCMTSNENALAFYQHLGGKLTGRVVPRDGYQDQAIVWEDLLGLMKKLSKK